MSDFEFQQATETKPRRGAGSAPPRANPSKPQTPTAAPVETNQETATNDKEPEMPAKPKYDADELARIFDDIIFSGEYAEEVTIKGKLRVRLRTRTAEEIEQISMLVDATTANLVSTLAEKRSILNLQYALVVYAGKDLRPLSIEDRSKFVKRLPGPVIGALLTALNDFDAKVYEACRDGEENF